MMEARWQRLSEVYDAALALAPAARASFLDSACADDRTLRADVESLLRHGLPSTPAVEAMAAALAHSSAPLVGTRMGPYRIDSLIGEGGMGQVYRARDEQLQRDVAIKVLPPVFALDANRRARFEREARLLASLNHPHIGAIHGIAEGDGVRGLVLELVDGDTLADRIHEASRNGGRGLTVQDALTFARQIAEALDTAHEKGVIHRDLKPANVKITSTGTVKVLDFGLAKATAGGDDLAAGPDEVVTRAGDTHAGAVVGTAAYMSPEQAQGKPVDKRADIWAFGCVLYEMLTGRPAFARNSLRETLEAVVNDSPDFSALPRSLPRATDLVRRCLEKDPRRRLRDIGDALIALDDTSSAPAEAVATAPSVPTGAVWRVAAIVLVTAVAAAVTAWTLKPPPVPPAPPIAPVELPILAMASPDGGLAVSPDGSRLAYACAGSPRLLCVRSRETGETRPLEGIEPSSSPFFSPDSKWIAFFAADRLSKVPADGGAVVPIADLSSGKFGRGYRGGTWTSDDTIMFAWGDGIWRVPASGGDPEAVTMVDRTKGEIYHRDPVVLPDGQTLLYSVWKGPGWDERELWAYRWRTGKQKLILKGAGLARYAPTYERTGHLVYTRAGRLLAVRFDPSQLEVGETVEMPETIREGTRYADVDVATRDGSLVYVHQHPDAYKRRPVLVDHQGRGEPLPNLEPAYYQAPALSHDGRQLALMRTDGVTDIVIYDMERRTSPIQLTTKGSSQYPVLSKDDWVYYRATRSGTRNIYRMPRGLGSGEEQVTTGEATHMPWSISSDGVLFYQEEGPDDGNGGVLTLFTNGDRKPQPLLDESDDASTPQISPDRRWLAYTSNRTRRGEVHIRAYPKSSRVWPVSPGGDPVWSRSGDELFFLDDGKMKSVKMTPGADPPFTTPSVVFDVAQNYVTREPGRDYDVLPGGRGFVMIQRTRVDPPITHVRFVMNWFEDLRKRLPADQ